MIGTTIDQSRMLMDLGLPLDSADMCWHTPDESYFPWMLSAEAYEDAFLHRAVYEDVIPAWSLSALLELFDNYELIKYDDGHYELEVDNCCLVSEGNETPFDLAIDLIAAGVNLRRQRNEDSD